jgi:hypothetical protein
MSPTSSQDVNLLAIGAEIDMTAAEVELALAGAGQ